MACDDVLVFGEKREPPPPGLGEFEQAMDEAVSVGGSAWVVTKAGEVFAGTVQLVRTSVEDIDLFGREVTVTIDGREVLFQEVSHWTVGTPGEDEGLPDSVG
jgi:hypothetical protein